MGKKRAIVANLLGNLYAKISGILADLRIPRLKISRYKEMQSRLEP
jgi:hypothetical protein